MWKTWKLLRTYLKSGASIVQAVVCRPLLLPLLLSRPIPSPDAVQARSTNLSKSTLAHDVVSAAVSHKPCLIICIGAGLIQFVYGSHSRLATELIYQRKNIFALVFRVLRIIKFTWFINFPALVFLSWHLKARCEDRDLKVGAEIDSFEINTVLINGGYKALHWIILDIGIIPSFLGDATESLRTQETVPDRDSWSLSHLGYLYPGTAPVMINLDHDRSCPWV